MNTDDGDTRLIATREIVTDAQDAVRIARETVAELKRYLEPLTDSEVRQLVELVQQGFRSFGGTQKGNGFNPLTHALEGKPAMFAAGVDIAEVVRFVAEGTALLRARRINAATASAGPGA